MSRILAITVPLAVALLVAARTPAQVIPCPPGTLPGVLCLQGSISDNDVGPLSGVVHCFGVVVPAGATLTLMPGTIIKNGANSLFQVTGLLNAGCGSIFTSIHDDMAGGDTNGNGGATLPMPGDWAGMRFNATSDFSVLSGAEVRYATTGITMNGADIFLTNTDILCCSGTGLDLGAPQQPSFGVVVNIDVSQCAFAIDRVAISAIPIFAQMTASGNTFGDFIRITGGSVTAMFNTIGPANSINGTGVFGVATIGGINVPAGSTLTFQPGTILKMDGVQQQVVVNGTLDMTNTTLTSIRDDTVGGDTEKDGATTAPAPSDWEGVLFSGPGSAASTVTGGAIRYGGVPGAFGGLPLDLTLGADITVDGLTVELCGTDAVRLGGDSFPTIRNCAIQNNAGGAMRRVPIEALAGLSNNSAGGNGGGDYVELMIGVGVDAVNAMVTLDPSQSLNQSGLFVFTERITVGPGGHLVFNPGCVVKWKPGTIGPAGRLIQVGTGGLITSNGSTTSPVIFTTITDDTVLGDSNLDGATTQPAPGEWGGLSFAPGTDASLLAQTVLRYAGAPILGAPTPTIGLNAAHVTITDCVIANGLGTGLDLATISFPTVCNTAFDGNRFPVSGVDIDAVPGFSNNTATGHVDGDFLAVVDGVVDGGSGTGAAVGTAVIAAINLFSPPILVVRDDIDVPTGSVLDLLDSFVVKVDGNHEIDVDGTLVTGSLGQGPVITSFLDDAHGGDTNGDGSTTVGAPSDWRGIDFATTADASVLQNLLIRFAGGAADGVAVDLNGAGVVLDQVTIRECAGTALDLSGTSFPQVSGCSFEQCGRAVDGVPITALPGFAGNSASLNAVSDTLRITDGNVGVNLLVDLLATLDGRPFVAMDDIDVQPGITLTIIGAVTIKWEGFRELDVQGTLNVVAGAGSPVLLTSLHDDANGDTNKNGNATLPAPGDWNRVLFRSASDASLVSGAIVRFAGGGTGGCVRLTGADITLVDSVVEHGLGDALDLGGSSRPQVRRCRFDHNSGIAVDAVPLGAVPGFVDDTAAGNGLGNHMRITTAALVAPVVIARQNALDDSGVFAVDTSITVGSGQSLTLDAGVVFKWQGAQRQLVVSSGAFQVRGTGLEPVTFTTITDDAVVGDTNLDGATTTPQPGAWRDLQLLNGAAPSRIEHLVLRFGGAVGQALQCGSPAGRLRSVRVESSATRGFSVSAHDGDAFNWVAHANGTSGIDLGGGAFDVVHATATLNGTVGVNASAAHSGALVNSIAFGNAGGAVAGFAPGEVRSSDAGPAFVGMDGNIDVDPLFADAAGGDLTLLPGSPCGDAAQLAPALAAVEDHVEASRILDDDLDGVALPDMGAFERAAYSMTVGGRPRLGTTLSFTVSGPPGLSIFLGGFLDGATFFSPYGFYLAGDATTAVVGAVLPTGTPFVVTIPDFPPAVGIEFGIQAVTFPNGTFAVGNFSNLYRGRLFN